MALFPFDLSLMNVTSLIGVGGVFFGALGWVIKFIRNISASITVTKKSLKETFKHLEEVGEKKSARSDTAMLVTLELDSLRHKANSLMHTITIYVVLIVLGYLSLYLEIVITEISGNSPTTLIFIVGLICMALVIIVMLIMWLRLNKHLINCEQRFIILWRKVVADRLSKAPGDLESLHL